MSEQMDIQRALSISGIPGILFPKVRNSHTILTQNQAWYTPTSDRCPNMKTLLPCTCLLVLQSKVIDQTDSCFSKKNPM